MIEIEGQVKKWGHSLGLVIPKESVRIGRIKVGQRVQILLRKKGKNVLKEVFGTFKFKEPTDKMMKDIDNLLYND